MAHGLSRNSDDKLLCYIVLREAVRSLCFLNDGVDELSLTVHLLVGSLHLATCSLHVKLYVLMKSYLFLAC